MNSNLVITMMVAILVTTEEAAARIQSNATGKEGPIKETSRTGKSAFEPIHAEHYDVTEGCSAELACSPSIQDDDCIYLAYVSNGDLTGYYGIDFGDVASALKIAVANNNTPEYATGRIDFRLDSPSRATFASVVTGFTGGWTTWVVTDEFLTYPVSGVHDLYLTYFRDCVHYPCPKDQDITNIDWFTFYDVAV